jgi:hypothetical protein
MGIPDDPESRIDATIARNKLMSSGIGPLWDALWFAVDETTTKINQHWKKELEAKLNSHNSVIRVFAPERYDDQTNKGVRPELEIRLDRTEGKVIARLTYPRSSVVEYSIKADVQSKSLYFDRDGVRISPLGLAEREVAERFANVSLD